MALNLKQGLFLYEEEEEEREQLKHASVADDDDSGNDANSEEDEEEFYEEEEEEGEEIPEEVVIVKNTPRTPPSPSPSSQEAPPPEAAAVAEDTLPTDIFPPPTALSPPATGRRNLLLTSYLNRPLKKRGDAVQREDTSPASPQYDLNNSGEEDSETVVAHPASLVVSPPHMALSPASPVNNVETNDNGYESSEDERDIEFLTAVMERGRASNREREVVQVFERASRDSFEGDDLILPDEEEMEVAAAEEDEEDVFTPSVPIEEQYFIQEKKAAVESGSASYMTKRFLTELPDNPDEHPSFPRPIEHRCSPPLEPEDTMTVAQYDVTPVVQPPSPAGFFPPTSTNDGGVAFFPPPQYTFTSANTHVDDDDVVEPPMPSPPQTPTPFPLPTAPVPAGLLEKSAANAAIAASNQNFWGRVNKTALAIRYRMLDEQTKNMHCNALVKVIFVGEDGELRNPSREMRQKLRRAIEAEMIVGRFVEYSKVVDINTSELFIQNSISLEETSRRHIMSNPLLSSIDLDTFIPGSGEPIPPQQHQDDVASLLGDEDSASVAKTATPASAAIATPPQVSLYQDLTDIISNPALNTDPAVRLAARTNLLKKILAYKIGNMCNISKMINLMSFIIKQAINTISGGAGRVLIANGETDNNTITSDDNLSLAGIDLLFGTIKGGVNGVIERTCVSVARLAMHIGVPVVMINWPNEFKSSTEYENILRDSILKFKNTSNVSLTFILDTIFEDEEDAPEDEELSGAREERERRLEPNEIMTNKEKAALIKDSIVNGTASARDMFSAFYRGDASLTKRGNGNTSAAYTPDIFYKSVEAVIEQKNRVTDNMLSGIVNGLENNKVIFSKIISRLITRASLAATMYYINSSSSKKTPNHNKGAKPESSSSSRVHSSRRTGTDEGGSGLSHLEKRRLLTASRRRHPGRSVLRSHMPVIAPPQRIMSVKAPKGSKNNSPGSEYLTDTDAMTPIAREAFREWSGNVERAGIEVL